MFLQENMVEIKDFPGYYVDPNGNIYSTKKNYGHSKQPQKMKLKEDKDGYLEVGLYKNCKRYYRRVHRLVANSFIPNPNRLPQINHKDGNRKNNHVDNLEWCTCSENLHHSFECLNRKYSGNHKSIRLLNKESGEEMIFYSIRECARYLNMSYEHLGKLLDGTKDISKWRKGNRYTISYLDTEDVTTISKESKTA